MASSLPSDWVNALNPYAYDILSESQIRLFRVQSIHQNVVVGSLVTCDVTNAQYVALSYCWGSQFVDGSSFPIDSNICVNGHRLSITKNLELLLRQALDHDLKWLWADAICINQLNSEERSTQVLRMDRIYAGAEYVVAWIGPYGYDKLDAMHAVVQNANLSEDYINGQWFREYENAVIAGQSESEIREVRMKFGPAIRKERERLFRNPYWQRVWIVQELVLANRVFLWVGRTTIEWEHFLRFHDSYNGEIAIENDYASQLRRRDPSSKNFRILTAQHPSIRTLRELRLRRRDGQNIFLLECLELGRHCQSTDPRDRIFAFLSLCIDGKQFVPKPSYSASLQRVFMDMTLSWIRTQESLDIICLGKSVFSSDLSLIYPSWSPSWSSIAPADDRRLFLKSSMLSHKDLIRLRQPIKTNFWKAGGLFDLSKTFRVEHSFLAVDGLSCGGHHYWRILSHQLQSEFASMAVSPFCQITNHSRILRLGDDAQSNYGIILSSMVGCSLPVSRTLMIRIDHAAAGPGSSIDHYVSLMRSAEQGDFQVRLPPSTASRLSDELTILFRSLASTLLQPYRILRVTTRCSYSYVG